MNKMIAIGSIFLLSLLSCTEGIYPQIGKPLSDPVVLSPRVTSFSEEANLTIEWDEDLAAEEYLLFRKKVTSLDKAKLIYRGTDIKYSDTDFPGLSGKGEVLFHYTLSKIRGLKEFGPSIPSLGIYSEYIEDPFEPNNTLTNARELSTFEITAMLYYFIDTNDNIVSDEDWFFIDLRPRQQAHIVLTQTGYDETSPFKYQIYRGESLEIALNDEITIPNTSNENRSIYFRIIPSARLFLGDTGTTGGSIKGYQLKIKKFTNTGDNE